MSRLSRRSAFNAVIGADNSLRASYTLLDDVMPKILAKGRRGEVVGRWLERAVFAVSTGGVVTVSCRSRGGRDLAGP